MISITKLDCFQPIDQQEEGEFGFAAEIWRTAAITELRKSCLKNSANLSTQAKFGQTVPYQS